MRALVVLSLLLVAPLARADAPFDGLVAAERAFARRCREIGVRDSFLEFFAEDAINFRDGPGLAVPRLRARPPTPKGVSLTWGPAVAEIARSGDFGWTTGPSVFTPAGGAPSTGWYFSVWKKVNGQWKVALDLGTDGPAAELPKKVARAGSGKSGKAADPLALDRRFCDQLAANAQTAYRDALAGDARIHRDGQAPMTDAAERAKFIAALPATMTCTPIGGAAAASGELGYAYGTYAAGDAKGGYVHLWRGDRLAVDVAVPAR